MSHVDTAFIDSVSKNHSVAAVLRSLGLRPSGANYSGVWRRIRALQLSTEHWTGRGHLRGRTHAWAKKMPLQEILRYPTRYRASSSLLKKRLFAEGILPRICDRCGIAEWLGHELTLHLDHVNGNSEDNRIGNLRVLCPNCHSQTPTYCGRNKGRASAMRTLSLVGIDALLTTERTTQ